MQGRLEQRILSADLMDHSVSLYCLVADPNHTVMEEQGTDWMIGPRAPEEGCSGLFLKLF